MKCPHCGKEIKAQVQLYAGGETTHQETKVYQLIYEPNDAILLSPLQGEWEMRSA